MARRQEQEDARTEISEVAPDVLRMELPIHMPGLGHVNMYALIDSDGAAVVDPGLPGPATWKAIQARLKQADLRVKNVHTVLITHSHPDHFGGAARFAEEAGARIVAHEAFRFGMEPPPPEVSVDDLSAQRDAAQEREVPESGDDGEKEGGVPHAHAHGHAHGHTHGRGYPQVQRQSQSPTPSAHWNRRTPWGGQSPRPPFRQRMRWRLMRLLRGGGMGFMVPEITHRVKHGEMIRLAGREWFVVHTPGHTEDHFCLHDPEAEVFLAGDHVLPTITPHISGLSASADPLNVFFESLDEVARITQVGQVLHANGHPFDDLSHRCRAIKQHHDERLEKVKSIGRELGPSTVEDYSKKLFAPRSWGSMAESETYAHLEHLRIAGDAERHTDAKGRYVYETG